MIQRSPSRVALVVRPARSEPLPGSLNSWHHAERAVVDRRHVPLDLLGRAVGEDRRRGHHHPEATGRPRPRRRRGTPSRPCPASGASSRGRPTRARSAARSTPRHRPAPTTRARSGRGPSCAATRRRPPAAVLRRLQVLLIAAAQRIAAGSGLRQSQQALDRLRGRTGDRSSR